MATESTTVGKVVYKVELDTSALDSGAKTVEKDLKNVGNSGKEIKNASSAFDDLAASVAGVVAAAQSLKIVTSGISEVTEAYADYQSAMMGVQSVASATGNDISASMALIKESTASGLLSEADAAAAMKNLMLYGYTAQQAAQLIDVLTNSAAFNRQATYSLSEAVRVTTEGIRMENSILSDAAGVQKNIAKMYLEYAQANDTTTESLTQAQKAQAVYNGIMAEAGMFMGDADRYSQTLSGSQLQLDQAITKVKQSMGALFEGFAPVISNLATWINENKALVAGMVTAVTVIVAAGGLIAAVKALITVVKMLGIATSSALGPLGLIIGIATAAGIAVGNMVAETGDLSNTLSTVTPAVNDFTDSTDNMTSAQKKAAEKLAEVQAQLAKLRREYERDLKEIGVKHQETIDKLTKQIEEANVDYADKIAERNAEFEKNQATEEKKHQEKVDELMAQLNFLQRYNNEYNAEKLAQVQFALAKEQSLYQQQTLKEKEELDIRNAADKKSLDQRLESLNAELQDEMAFMEKHREDLNSVRHVMLLDEIESLKERYNEQVTSARKSGEDAAKTLTQSLQNNLGKIDASQMFSDTGNQAYNAGANASKNYGDGAIMGIKNHLKQGGIIADIWKFLLGEERYERWSRGDIGWLNRLRGYAMGGYTGNGSKAEVAGVVHKGEYVLPQEMVDQSTGTPKLGQPVTININMSGVLATSEQAKRDLAMELSKSLSQVMKARSLA